MRDFYLIAFILALPPLAVLGHDIYLASTNTQLDVTERFFLSDLGWLWVNYHSESYNWALENTDRAIWNSVVEPLLKSSALYVTGIPFAVLIVITVFMKIFGLGPFQGRSLGMSLFGAKYRKKSDFSFGGGGKKKVKYKRK